MVGESVPKHGSWRRLGAYAAAFVLLVALGWLGVAVWREARRSMVVEERVREVRREVEKLTANRDELARMLTALQDPSALEREAKTQLNLRRPDERVVIVVPDDGTISVVVPTTSEITAAPVAPEGATGNLLSWWEYFFGARRPR